MENIVFCPKCDGPIIIEQLNCGIFIHGVCKVNHTQVNPHSNTEEVKIMLYDDKIWGCGQQFKVSIVDGKYILTECENL